MSWHWPLPPLASPGRHCRFPLALSSAYPVQGRKDSSSITGEVRKSLEGRSPVRFTWSLSSPLSVHSAHCGLHTLTSLCPPVPLGLDSCSEFVCDTVSGRLPLDPDPDSGPTAFGKTALPCNAYPSPSGHHYSELFGL